jgi:D-glycero-D-manno-heptose 1,7-bisphosphate phosphatase
MMPSHGSDINSIKLVILDRDGVINYDSDKYIKSPDEWVPIPGSLQAIAALKCAGWTVAVATNQSGLSRGFFDKAILQSIHQKMSELLAEQQYSISIDYLVFCPHAPEANCACRKPKPGLYHQIAAHFGCSLEKVPVIGDSNRDLEAAVAVGSRPILVLTGKGEKTLAAREFPPGTEVFPDLCAAANVLLAEDNSRGTGG